MGQAPYKYVWVKPLLGAAVLSLADLKFKGNGGKEVKPISAFQALGTGQLGDRATSAIDDNKGTIFNQDFYNRRGRISLNQNNGIIVEFAQPTSLDAITYVTGDGKFKIGSWQCKTICDPQSFELKGSDDKETWHNIHRMSCDLNPPSAGWSRRRQVRVNRLYQMPWHEFVPLRKLGFKCDQDAQCSSYLCLAGTCKEKSPLNAECSRKEECETQACASGKCKNAQRKLLQFVGALSPYQSARRRGMPGPKCVTQSASGTLEFSACNKKDERQLWNWGPSGALQNAKSGKCMALGKSS
eukprot:gnl/MRDRNA2_/MRDRNA2_15521_c0_seq1.p1 gnl/MRDRNA2_/MRDRNA2_15521_c0~~gnl/MRDRNA2_/MRDRNA2_15521_c0_seq1.p1  ORF type:complete len:345 (-),score=41.23 gnl/MRDRNA2_/MRDRNA2_15521_c0_seq1:394-1287(-)